jgi:hypothetical protein
MSQAPDELIQNLTANLLSRLSEIYVVYGGSSANFDAIVTALANDPNLDPQRLQEAFQGVSTGASISLDDLFEIGAAFALRAQRHLANGNHTQAWTDVSFSQFQTERCLQCNSTDAKHVWELDLRLREGLSDLQRYPQPLRREVRRLLCEIISEQGNAIDPTSSEGSLIVTYVFGECNTLEQAADTLQWDRQKAFEALRAIVEGASASGCTRQEFGTYMSQAGSVCEALKRASTGTLPTLNRGEETAHA